MIRIPALISIAACALFAALPASAFAAELPVFDQYDNPAAEPPPTTDIKPASDTPVTPPVVDPGSANEGVTSPAPVVEPEPGDTLGNADATDPTGITVIPVKATKVVSAPVTGGGEVGSLPFTGAELTSVLIAGFLLLGSGVVLRRVGFAGSRRSRKDDQA